ncbi:MAG TPA: HTTM domain-containing protein [Aeromicrobium sp.]|nr:HTTM domain-containing protein [Aeromicrobium sp.]
MDGVDRLVERSRQPVDPASLAVFRICFGLIALWEVGRYFHHDWIHRYWEEPKFHFHYVGWGWVEPLPAPGMVVLWGVLGAAALCIAVGAFYRLATVVFAVGFGYSFLLETARYLNHFYFIELLAILLVFVPAHRVWSVDAWRHRWGHRQPSPAWATAWAPAWALWLLRFQIAVVYVGGGIAKMDPDWLRGQPMGAWLSHDTDFIFIGGLFDHPWAGIVAAWMGMFFDLGIVFAVWWGTTRLLALNAAVLFHLINSELFVIGVFPFLALASLLLFCPPDWPRQVVAELQARKRTPRVFDPPGDRPRFAHAWFALAALFVAAQVLIPLRHIVMPGRAAWTEAGHTFSWHMKLRDKEGEARFRVVDPKSGKATLVDPRNELTSWQYTAMTGRPELLRQYAAHLATTMTADGRRPKVQALTAVTLNGREPQPLIDPSVDLGAQRPTLGTPPWVVPLKQPLPKHPDL